jgi:hypothetical protein
MSKIRKSSYRTRAIVTGYLEKVSAEVFDSYQKEITDERIVYPLGINCQSLRDEL